jgi:hypothetical protein
MAQHWEIGKSFVRSSTILKDTAPSRNGLGKRVPFTTLRAEQLKNPYGLPAHKTIDDVTDLGPDCWIEGTYQHDIDHGGVEEKAHMAVFRLHDGKFSAPMEITTKMIQDYYNHMCSQHGGEVAWWKYTQQQGNINVNGEALMPQGIYIKYLREHATSMIPGMSENPSDTVQRMQAQEMVQGVERLSVSPHKVSPSPLHPSPSNFASVDDPDDITFLVMLFDGKCGYVQSGKSDVDQQRLINVSDSVRGKAEVLELMKNYFESQCPTLYAYTKHSLPAWDYTAIQDKTRKVMATGSSADKSQILLEAQKMERLYRMMLSVFSESYLQECKNIKVKEEVVNQGGDLNYDVL